MLFRSGVIVYKVVGNRYLEKRVNIRVEHIRHSKCRQEFLDRVKRNNVALAEAKAKGGACPAPSLDHGILIGYPDVQSVSTSVASRSSPAPPVSSRQKTTHRRRWSLYHTRPPSKTAHVSSDRLPLTIAPLRGYAVPCCCRCRLFYASMQ